MRKMIIVTAACLLAGLAAPAMASSDDNASCRSTSGKQMTVQEITDQVSGMGYDVRKVEREKGCFEVKAIDNNGSRVELELNPETGAIVRTEKRS